MSDLSTYAFHMGCILKVLVYIEERCDEPMNLEKMAEIACISPYYFHRLFRAYMGETLADYIKRLRLQVAEERLRYTDDPITEIALDAGYETPSAFTKVFNQVMGQSPREYRKIMQPLFQAIINRMGPGQHTQLKPEYVTREKEKVLFVRRVGDYRETPWQAFAALDEFLEKEGKKSKVKGYYSFALDNPQVVERHKCRFDACVALSDDSSPKGEVGQRTLPGGRFAVFTHRGPYTELEETFIKIFIYWYPTVKATLADADPFCKYINVADPTIPDSDRETKCYIPLEPC